jgi:hypothetical protein
MGKLLEYPVAIIRQAARGRLPAPMFEVSALIIPLFVLGMLAYLAFGNQSAGSVDEGINLMKGMLASRGYHLYRDVWDDQPPVFTWLLAGMFHFFGATLEGGRSLVVFFAILLLWSLFQILRLLEDIGTGLIAVFFVAASQQFIPLSHEVTIGIPAIGLGVFAIWMIVQWRLAVSARTAWIWGTMAALTYAMSIETKFLSLTLLPCLIALIVLPQTSAVGNFMVAQCAKRYHNPVIPTSFRKRFRHAILWLIGSVTIALLIGVVAEVDLTQLLLPHLRLRAKISPGTGLTLPRLIESVIIAMPYLVPMSAFGLIVNIYRRRWQCLLPIIWLASSTIVLIEHRPLRSHYAIVFGIPLAWSAAIGADAVLLLFVRAHDQMAHVKRNGLNWLVRRSGGGPVRPILAAIIVGSMVAICFDCERRISAQLALLRQDWWTYSVENQQVVDQLHRYSKSTHWIYSDLPVYAFEADLIMPPEVAVISQKRRDSGFLDDEDLVGIFARYKPEQILIGRFQYGQCVQEYLQEHYTLIWEGDVGDGPLLCQYVMNNQQVVESER